MAKQDQKGGTVEPMLTIVEAATRLHVSRDTVRRLVLSGALKAYKLGCEKGEMGGRYIIPESALAEWLESRAVTPAA